MELLLIMPFFVILVAGTALVAKSLYLKDRAERAAWVYSMSRAHHLGKEESQTAAFRTFPNHDFPQESVVEGNKACLLDVASALRNAGDVPLVFSIYQGTHCRKKDRLKVTMNSPRFLRRLFSEKFSFVPGQASRSVRHIMTTTKLEVKASYPEGDLYDAFWWKQAFFYAGSVEAGFGWVPLQFIGGPEILRAVGIWGGFSGNVTNFANDFQLGGNSMNAESMLGEFTQSRLDGLQDEVLNFAEQEVLSGMEQLESELIGDIR